MGGGAHSRHHRQHRHLGAGVVVAVAQRQRPEVRGRPVEHEREQDPGAEVQAAGHRHPAHQYRRRPGRPADHDVVGAGPLEAQRVHEHVIEESGGGQEGRREVDRHRQPQKAGGAQRHSEPQRALRRHRPAHQGPLRGAAHAAVDVAVGVAVESVGACCRQGPPDEGGHHRPSSRPAARRHHHGGHGGDQEQLDDAGFGERHVGGEQAHDAGPGAAGIGDDDGRLRRRAHELLRKRGRVYRSRSCCSPAAIPLDHAEALGNPRWSSSPLQPSAAAPHVGPPWTREVRCRGPSLLRAASRSWNWCRRWSSGNCPATLGIRGRRPRCHSRPLRRQRGRRGAGGGSRGLAMKPPGLRLARALADRIVRPQRSVGSLERGVDGAHHA